MKKIDNLIRQLKSLLPPSWEIHTERLSPTQEAYWSLGKTKETYETIILAEGGTLGMSLYIQPEGLPPRASFVIASMVRDAISFKLSEMREGQRLTAWGKQAQN